MSKRHIKSMLIIRPKDHPVTRWLKYRIAFYWRILHAFMRRMPSGNHEVSERISSLEDMQSISIPKLHSIADQQRKKPIILLLGPYHFKQPMWSVRAKAALPDLFDPLSRVAELHWVTPIPTLEACSSINRMTKELNVYHHLLPPDFNLKSLHEKSVILDELAATIKPQLIMNPFGVIASGFDAVACAKRNNAISVLRVPGDELSALRKMTDGQNQSALSVNKASFAIQNADQVMVMSESEQSRVSKDRLTTDGVFIQIRGVDINHFHPLDNNERKENSPINVGFVGRLTKEKGTDILFEVMERLSSEQNILFHIASPEEVDESIRHKYKNLVWHGYVDHMNMPNFMQKLDVLILPSHMEGRSQTMMEAMASGLPVLMQKHIHPDCLPGMIHCDDKAETFSKAINELASDRKKLSSHSMQARQSALKYFDKDVWSEKMMKSFQNILSGE